MKRFVIVCLLFAFSLGCGEDASTPQSSVTIPSLAYGDYAVEGISLGAPVDNLDLAVLAGRPPLVEKTNGNFGTLTLNIF